MKLYHLFHFDRSLKVRWLAKELNIDLEEIIMDAFSGEHLEAPFSDLNPYGLVPTLEKDNGESLFEGTAICIDLCQQQKSDLYINDDAQFNQWLFYFASSLDQLSGGIAMLKVFGESKDMRDFLESRLPSKLTAMNEHLKNKTYWYQDRFTLLDILAWQNLAYLSSDGQLNGYEHLLTYVAEIAKRPCLAEFSPNKLLNPENKTAA